MIRLKILIQFGLLVVCLYSFAEPKGYEQSNFYDSYSSSKYIHRPQANQSSDNSDVLEKNNWLSNREKKECWKLLFDGKSTKQWRGQNKKSSSNLGWRVVNGELISCTQGDEKAVKYGDLITKKQFSDFILKWEWQIKTKGGNSGLKYFVQEGIGINKGHFYGLEYQILDDQNHEWMLQGKMKPNDFRTLGSLYEIYPASPDKHPNPLGMWNESMVVSKGKKVEHWLNGEKILEYERGSSDFNEKIAASKFKDISDFGILSKGHLLLQDHGNVVSFRNIKIKELTSKK